MSSEKNYDDLIYPILCSEGNIVDFFDKIFDFLHRRTDFFKFKTEDDSMGLVPGEAEKIVRSVFCKYMEQAVSEQKNSISSELDPVVADYVSEETVVTSSESIETEECVNEETTNLKNEGLSKEQCKEEDNSDAKIPVMDPDSYNGASYEDYSWAQTIKDADIRIKVPDTITTGKQVHVLIQQTHLKVEVLLDNKWKVLKDNDLSEKINVEESTWTLIPREHIHICLQKIQEKWWNAFFTEEPKIDLKSIDPSIAYEELDQESQAKINELMYNQHLKRLGKPTIQQNKVQDILKEAWDNEGSPFKGQPYDPTLIDIQNADALVGH